VCDLAAHYRLHELTQERKAFSTIESHRILFERYIEPRWGHFQLCAVRTIQEWLQSLALAPSSKAKLKSILSLYNHAIRYEWITFNQSAEQELRRSVSVTRTFSPPKSSSVLRDSYRYATGQWYCLLVALVCADPK
jgi:hypothetical protein